MDSQIRLNFSNFLGQNYELALNQSIQTLLDSLHEPNFDSSVFASIFLELLQSRIDPPLETIWVYSALTFLNLSSQKERSFDRLAVTKELFQLISSCSVSSSSSKSIALMAPVLCNLYSVIIDLKEKDMGFKAERKAMRKIKALVDVILGYINVCCEGLRGDGDSDKLQMGSDNMTMPLEDLVSVWIGDRLVEKGVEGLSVFFPLLTVDIVEWLHNGECGISELAGVVILEAFLLKLWLGICEGDMKMDLKNELRTWAVGSVTGFQNIHFFETLVRMLLEPTLPVTCLLNLEDEVFMREVLYDAVILVEYAFLNPYIVDHLSPKTIRRLAIARLMVTHEAIELFRKQGHQTKALSYTTAFSGSHLHSQLMKWVTSEIGMESKDSGPNGSSPKAFLKWLVRLENKGIRLLDGCLSKHRAQLVLDNSKEDYGQSAYKTDGNKADADLLFYIDNKGEEKDGNEEDEKTNIP
ncbi:unnamed protein product [Ilex paraguariensis]|uniref:Uncharacterized protein n=1 Tax=Ilex paraguariensis TaxID=185542 RepID=A0ABC8RHL0_9AQUA